VELVPLYFRYRRTQRLNTTSSAIINKRSSQQQQHLLLAICKKNAQQLHVAASGKSNSNNRKQTIVLSPALKSAPNPRGHPIYCRHFGSPSSQSPTFCACAHRKAESFAMASSSKRVLESRTPAKDFPAIQSLATFRITRSSRTSPAGKCGISWCARECVPFEREKRNSPSKQLQKKVKSKKKHTQVPKFRSPCKAHKPQTESLIKKSPAVDNIVSRSLHVDTA